MVGRSAVALAGWQGPASDLVPTGTKVSYARSMVLSDKLLKEETARGRVVIRPLDPLCVQPASLDVHLGKKLLFFPKIHHPHMIDVKERTHAFTQLTEIPEGEPFILHPHEFDLGSKYQGQSEPTPSHFYRDFL